MQFWKLHITGLHLGLHVCRRTCNIMFGLTVALRRLPELIISKWLSTALSLYPPNLGWIVMFCKTKTPKSNCMRRDLCYRSLKSGGIKIYMWVIYTAKNLVPALVSFLQIANLNKAPFFGNTCAPVVQAWLELKERVECSLRSLCSLCGLHCGQASTMHLALCTISFCKLLFTILLQAGLCH